MKKDDFHDYIMHDVFSGMYGITSRPLFGGHGIYKDGVIFAIIVKDELYFKVGEKNRQDFNKYDSEPFRYTMPNGKKVEMPYRKLPDEIMEDRGALPAWIEKSVYPKQNGSKKKPPKK